MAGTLYYFTDGRYVLNSSISRDKFAQDLRVGDYVELKSIDEKAPLLITKIVHHPTNYGGNCDIYLQHVDCDAEKKAKEKEIERAKEREKEIERANCKILYI